MASKEQDEKDEDYTSPEIAPIKVDVSSIEIEPVGEADISDPIELRIRFELDRDAVASYWVIKLLVDSCDKRIIKILGETSVEDYVDGDSEMYFSSERIDISGISPSALANSGLLMAVFVVDGEEVASVNMVVNVTKRDGRFVREILNPLS